MRNSFAFALLGLIGAFPPLDPPVAQTATASPAPFEHRGGFVGIGLHV